MISPCVCGGAVRRSEAVAPAAAQDRHNRSRLHRAWRDRIERIPSIAVATLRIRTAPAAGAPDPARSVRTALDRLDELDMILGALGRLRGIPA